ncbi:MAG TPA: GNAT family N-acetyltransferase [Actinoplanes sp.]|nr:GNAT family N-acetyltransferase [Actinoplanes sp.]
MTYQVRPLGPEDQRSAWDLGSLTFGYHERPMPEDWSATPAGRRSLGVFDPAGRLVGKAVDREQSQWFGGRAVPTSGVAGVATAADVRGQGLGRLVLTRLLEDARDRGAAISTLFDTVPGPYRALGWEEVGVLTYHRVVTRVLAEIRPGGGTVLRPAAEADIPAVQDVYRSVARAGTGMMERPAGPVLDDHDGVTVAAGPDGTITGYATWTRGPGYDESGRITVDDLIGVTPEATRTLLAMVGGWASVAPTTVIRLGVTDPAWSLIARRDAVPDSTNPWMLRIVDAPAAIAARGWPRHLTGQVHLDLTDDVCRWHEGRHRLLLSGGEARLEPGGDGTVRLTPRGLAAWYAGAATPQQLRHSGFLTGGDETTDDLLRTATAGPVPTLHDYF